MNLNPSIPLNQLVDRQAELRRLLANIDPRTEQYRVLSAQLGTANHEVRTIRTACTLS